MIPLNPIYYNFVDEINKDFDKALRNIFRGEIKGNFLIKMYHKVYDIIAPELNKYYPLDSSIENIITGGSVIYQYDICKIIIGLHKSNMIFVPESERLKKQDSELYQQRLVNEVIENIKLRKYGSSFFRQKQIIYRDRFLYFHLPYDLFVICTKMNELLIENKNNKIPLYNHFRKISNVGLSALSLLEDNFLDNAYPLCRTLIELFVETIVLIDNPEAQKCYSDFSQIEVEKAQCGIEYSQEFLNLYEMRKNQNENKKNMFLHFGWVDKIKNYHKLVRKNPYSFGGLIEYLKSKDEGYEIYENFYKKCHSYSHANIIGIRYPLLLYFEISIMLYITVINTYIILCNYLKIETKIEGIDIVDKALKDYELVVNQFNSRNTENFENYYKHN